MFNSNFALLYPGGGSGIGRAVCQIFAREGARVAVVDVNEQQIQDTVKQIGGKSHSNLFHVIYSGQV